MSQQADQGRRRERADDPAPAAAPAPAYGPDAAAGGAAAVAVAGAPGGSLGARTGRPSRPQPARLMSVRSRWAMRSCFALAIAVYVVFAVVPTIGNIVISVSTFNLLSGASLSFVGGQNYVDLVTDQLPGLINSLIVTAIFVVAVTVVQNVIGLALAHRLRRNTVHAAFLRVLVFLPIVLGVTVVGLIWILLMDPSSGPVATVLRGMGVNSAFFGSSSAALPLVIIVQIWQNLGFTMILFIGGLNAIPQEIYDAAAVDGVSPWRRFTSVTLPLMAPSVSASVLLAVVGSFTTYNLIYVLTQGQFNTDTLGMFSFNAAFGPSSNIGSGAAVSIILFVLTLIIALPLMGYLRHRERALFS